MWFASRTWLVSSIRIHHVDKQRLSWSSSHDWQDEEVIRIFLLVEKHFLLFERRPQTCTNQCRWQSDKVIYDVISFRFQRKGFPW